MTTTTYPPASPSPHGYDERADLLCRNWGFVALRGVIAIVFGVVAIALPGPTLASLVLLFAIYMLLDGALGILSGARAARSGQRWGWLILEGIANIAAGVIAILWPGITVVVLVWVVAFWALVSARS